MRNIKSIIGQFETSGELLKAAKATYAKGYRNFETYSPFPIHGMDNAMGLKASKLPWIVLVCGGLGLSFGLGLQTWVATYAYKLTISGKPFFSYQAFVPVTFELLVLFSAFGTVFGMFALNKLPKWYNGLFKSSNFASASSHSFFLEVQSDDRHFNTETTTAFLAEIGASNIEEVSQ